MKSELGAPMTLDNTLPRCELGFLVQRASRRGWDARKFGAVAGQAIQAAPAQTATNPLDGRLGAVA
jgi:hypothetical protein